MNTHPPYKKPTLKSIADRVSLSDGNNIPRLGLGTAGETAPEKMAAAITAALELGYRHFDTASFYQNEEGIGRGIAKGLASGISREELFITTKVWTSEQGYENTKAALAASLKRLQLDYVDLYLIHWPKPQLTAETWRAMKELKAAGKIRSLGVSNFHAHHLFPLLNDEVKPVVNQIEMHPQFQQHELQAYCEAHNIYAEAWSPLIRSSERLNDLKPLTAIAERLGKTPAQVTLRWLLERDVLIIPKTVRPERMQENAALYDFELSAADHAAIATLQRNRLWEHPDDDPY